MPTFFEWFPDPREELIEILMNKSISIRNNGEWAKKEINSSVFLATLNKDLICADIINRSLYTEINEDLSNLIDTYINQDKNKFYRKLVNPIQFWVIGDGFVEFDMSEIEVLDE
jgi:hypothetical protein